MRRSGAAGRDMQAESRSPPGGGATRHQFLTLTAAVPRASSNKESACAAGSATEHDVTLRLELRDCGLSPHRRRHAVERIVELSSAAEIIHLDLCLR